MNTLLINPSSTKQIYGRSAIRAVSLKRPPLNLATIASALVNNGHRTQILNLDNSNAGDTKLYRMLMDFRPELVGITGTTPLYNEIMRLIRLIKKREPSVKIVIGGHHAAVSPDSFLKDGYADISATGEGDFLLSEIASGASLRDIKGISYNDNGTRRKNAPRPKINDMDTLPFPAWHLFNLAEYKSSGIVARANPCGSIETSRGCPHNCIFCSKTIFGKDFRAKSPARVVDEMEYMLKAGFKEIHVQDDCFSRDLGRAKEICELILRRGLKFSWALFNGIRVDSVDADLLHKLKRAGCYRVGLGIESGDQEILDACCKNIRIEQIVGTVKLIKAAGLETFGFFMIGLPKESVKTMQKTINFAKELKLDLYKFGFAIPYPGTALYDDWKEKGYIKSEDWSEYRFHNNGLSRDIFDHPDLAWHELNAYYRKAYMKMGFNISYLMKNNSVYKFLKRAVNTVFI